MAYPTTIPVRLFKQGEFAVINGKKYVPERTCKPVVAEDGANEGCRVCSECGRLYWSTPFCAYCGAKVVGE